MHTKVSIIKFFAALILGLSVFANVSFAEQAKDQSKAAAIEKAIETINVNKADATALAKALKGIGTKKAEAIVAFRELHGPFLAAEEMKQVKGLGDAFIAKNESRITFE